MSNEYYDHTTVPPAGSFGRSREIRAEFAKIEVGFTKLPVIAGNLSRFVFIKADGSGQTSSADLVQGAGEVIATKLRVTDAIPVGDATDRVATTAFVASVALSTALPGQTGNAGRVISTDGATASWVQGSQMAVLGLINQGLV